MTCNDLDRKLTVGIEPTTCYHNNPQPPRASSGKESNRVAERAQHHPKRSRTVAASGNEVATAVDFDAGAEKCHSGCRIGAA